MTNWAKENKNVLIGGLTPGAVVALTYLTFVYSIWVSLAVCAGSFIIVNALILLIESRKTK